MSDHEATAKRLVDQWEDVWMPGINPRFRVDLVERVAAALAACDEIKEITKHEAAMWREFYTFDPRADTIKRVVELKDIIRARDEEIVKLKDLYDERDAHQKALIAHVGNGFGGICAKCGFRYHEHEGHIVPCPLCELSKLKAALNSVSFPDRRWK